MSLKVIASASQFHIYLPWGQPCLAYCLNSVLNGKALVGAFNQEKALVGAFSVIVQPVVEPMDRFAALHNTHPLPRVSDSAARGPAEPIISLCFCDTRRSGRRTRRNININTTTSTSAIYHRYSALIRDRYFTAAQMSLDWAPPPRVSACRSFRAANEPSAKFSQSRIAKRPY